MMQLPKLGEHENGLVSNLLLIIFLNNFQLGTETFPIVGVGYYFFSLEKGFVPKY